MSTGRPSTHLSDEYAAGESTARAEGAKVRSPVIEALRAEVEHVRADAEFAAAARRILDRDRELIERLVK